MLMKAGISDPSQRVGLDISAEYFDATIMVGGSRKEAQFHFTNSSFNQFRAWLRKNGVTKPHLWMEATGRYFERLAEWAIDQGWLVSVVNPRRVRQFALSKLKTSKTDRLDARVMWAYAEVAKADEMQLWHKKSEAQKELRDLQLVIRGMKKEIGQQTNRLKCGLTSELAKKAIRSVITELNKHVKELHRASMALIKSEPTLLRKYKALSQVRGFGDVTVALLLAKIDFRLFDKGRQLVKYAGLDTIQKQSGKSVRGKNRISRVGHSALRSALYLPAVVARRHDPGSKELADRLETGGATKKLALCAVMARLLRVAYAKVQEAETLALAKS